MASNDAITLSKKGGVLDNHEVKVSYICQVSENINKFLLIIKITEQRTYCVDKYSNS